MIKVLHTGDIHLDAPFSKLDVNHAEMRRSELRASFTSMMMYARTNNVDLILMAGDIFDNDFVTRETIALIRREFERVPAKIVISPGNHDFVSEKSIWKSTGVFPPNVYIFTDDRPSVFSFDDIGVDVYGYAVTSPDMYKWPLDGRKVYNPEKINLVCAHAHITSSPSPYCPITPEQIGDFGADYTALGHVHNPPESIGKAGGGYYAYCGCLEGRSFNELGPKGALVLEMDKKNGVFSLTPRKLRFSKKVYEYSEIKVDGAKTLTDIESAISAVVSEKKYSDDVMLQVRLTGSVDPSLIINKQILSSLFPNLAYLDIIDDTSPTFDTDALMSDMTVRGEFFRVLLPRLNSDNEKEREIASAALKAGLSALSGENIAY